MAIGLRALTLQDVGAYNAGEDDLTVRWLSGGYGTVESTTGWFEHLADNAVSGRGPQGFGVFLDGRQAGYVEYNVDVRDGLEPGDVNISYGVHPWARGRGVAAEAVRLICDLIRERRAGTRAAIGSWSKTRRRCGPPRSVAASFSYAISSPRPTTVRTVSR